MIAVSEAWKDIQQRFILPETFLEITCGITDVGVQDLAAPRGTNAAVFSSSENIAGNTGTITPKRYATLERNLWTLDGTRSVVPNSAPYGNVGYASNDFSAAGVEIIFPESRPVAIPGLTITWSSEYNEYPTQFSVTARNGSDIVASAYVGNNTDVVSVVDMEMVDYDRLVIEVYGWNVPDHRARIDLVMFGHVISFSKSDVMRFTHEQRGDLNSGELTKNSIDFALDNSTGQWNPSNPTGLGKYLSERQKVNVRYGMTVNGSTEWIKAGTFYLSEWRAPANGMEASFVARDVFEYLLNEPYTGPKNGTLKQFVESAFESAPEDLELEIDDSLSGITAEFGEDEHTQAEVVQMCANAAGCVIRHDRSGKVFIEPLNTTHSGYSITAALSYSHPELTLAKPLKAVSVAYSGETYSLPVSISGETQTVNNPLINTLGRAQGIAEWVRDTMESRKTLDGEFRADPRLDLFDVVTVESKYGQIAPVAITDVKYQYTGAFRANYTGRVLSGAAATNLEV